MVGDLGMLGIAFVRSDREDVDLADLRSYRW